MAGVKQIRSGSKIPVGGSRKHVHRSPIDKAKGYEVIWPQVAPLFEAARRFADASFVYLIGEPDDGAVKIGVSKDPIARLRGMQTGNPRRLKIEHVLLGGREIEKLLQEMWEPHAVLSARHGGKVDRAPGTEWFEPTVRAQLFPVVETAAAAQVLFLNEASGDVSHKDMDRIIRRAHGVHDVEAHGREEMRLLAAGAGYVAISRRSRI